MGHIKNALTGSGKIGNGFIIPDPNDSTKNIEDPNWEDYTHKGKPITKGSITYKNGDTIPGNRWKTYDSKTIKNAPKGTKVGDIKLNKKRQ